MTIPPTSSTILVIGNDQMLTYLLNRYVEQSDRQMVLREIAPEPAEIRRLQPAALIFASIERLQASLNLIDALSSLEIPLLVCVSLTDEARAYELGADACLLHPLTYENFWAALSVVCPPASN